MKVYKYRGISTFERDLSSLVKNQVFAPLYENLNDPFEGIYNNSISRILDSIELMFNTDASDVREKFNKVLGYKDKLGIYSLSKNYSNELLWSHYAESHKGYCIEYDLKKLKENYLIPTKVNQLLVDYKKRPQVLSIDDLKNSNRFLRKLFATKSRVWKYEDEIRLIFDSSSTKEYHPSALLSIYFGTEMTTKHKDDLISELSNRDINFYQIKRDTKSYQLKKELIHSNRRNLKHNLDDFDFEIIDKKEEPTIDNFYLFSPKMMDNETMHNFFVAFAEKHTTRKFNLFLFDIKEEIKPLIYNTKSVSQIEFYESHLISQYSNLANEPYYINFIK